MVDVKALIEYNMRIRHKYFDALTKLPWDELVKNREASWFSMRNIFIHTLGAVNHWLSFLENDKHKFVGNFDDYKTPDELRELMQTVEARMQNYLALLTPDILFKKYMVENDAGERIEVTTEDALIHVFEEEVHHRGELIALLWQMNIEPPLMGWKYL